MSESRENVTCDSCGKRMELGNLVIHMDVAHGIMPDSFIDFTIEDKTKGQDFS